TTDTTGNTDTTGTNGTNGTNGDSRDRAAVTRRLEQLAEAIEVCRSMFTDPSPSFDGAHYRIRDAVNLPGPMGPDGVPVLVGGRSEDVVRVAARFADAVNTFGGEDIVRRTGVRLARFADEAGRDRTAIALTH